MKNVKFIQNRSYRNFLFLAIILFGSNNLQAQKNAIKITPLKPTFQKANIGYERFFKNNWSATADFQFWFQDKDKVEEVFFGTNKKYNLKNKGLRSSLELRKYFTVGNKNKKIQHDFNIAISSFFGKHHIETSRKGYITSGINLSGILGTETSNSYVPPSHGSVDIISKGIAFHIAYRMLWKNGIFIQTEIIRRRSWINYGKDSYPLISETPTPDVPVEKFDFNSQINGSSIEPKLSIGYMF